VTDIAKNGTDLAERLADKTIRIAAFRLVDIFHRALSQPGTGREYTQRFYRDAKGRLRKGVKRVPHRASAAGQPPAPDTGTLRRGVRTDGRVEAATGQRFVKVALGPRYGLYLEYGVPPGADGKGRIAPRPWIRPGIKVLAAEFPSIAATVSRGPARG
jgi:hypothetical protein